MVDDSWYWYMVPKENSAINEKIKTILRCFHLTTPLYEFKLNPY